MKRILCFFLILICAAGIFGCSSGSDVPEDAATVYYKRANISYGDRDGVIGASHLDTDGKEGDFSYLLGKYLQTPPGDGFSQTFPANLFLVSLKVEGLTAKVILSDQMAKLSGMDLTVACACLTRTVMSLTGCQEVIISAISAQLDGRDFITLSADSYLLLDSSVRDPQ